MRSASKEEPENGTPSQTEGEQFETQTSPIQGTTSAAVSAPVSAPDQSVSNVNPESDNPANTSNSTIQSTSITAGQNWFLPPSVTTYQTPTLAIEHVGQNTAPQSTIKQLAVQAPLGEENETISANEPLSTQTQSESVAVTTPSVQAISDTPTRPSFPIVTRVSWHAISGGTTVQAPTSANEHAGQNTPSQSTIKRVAVQAPLVRSGAMISEAKSDSSLKQSQPVTDATPDTSAATSHMVWSATTFSAPVASAPRQQIPAGGSASGAQSQTSGRTTNRKASGRQVAQIASVVGNFVAPDVAVLPQPDQLNPSIAQKSAGQGTVQSLSDLATDTWSKAPNFQIVPAAQDAPQTHISDSAPTASTPERTVTPLEHFAPAMPQNGPVNNQSAADQSITPSVSSGTQDAKVDPSAITAGVVLPETMPLPVADPFPVVGSGSAVINNPSQKATSNAGGSKSSDFTIASNTVTTKTRLDARASDTASSHSVQNSQTDPSQSAAPAPRIADNGATHLQTQTGVSQPVSHDSPITPRVATGVPDGSHVSDQRELHASSESESGASVRSSGINTTKLMQTMNETEMRIGMSSSDFGEISIRTTVSNHQMLTQISLDHSELSQALSAHVASVQTKLGDEYGLHASIEINNLASSHSGEQGASSQKENGSFAGRSMANSDIAPAEEENGPSLGAVAAAGSDYRLDIRA
ncbi:MAG: hypothetical protein WBQ94_19670 [Terracidiphilus sp.]